MIGERVTTREEILVGAPNGELSPFKKHISISSPTRMSIKQNVKCVIPSICLLEFGNATNVIFLFASRVVETDMIFGTSINAQLIELDAKS